ncbi:MAG: leucine-rich repeat domain-containing protein [Oscillospiraceae bacterium]|nr:leucine-rich repeat domain-containing protein [Oscillospiraceae bacterium]
MNKLIRCLTGIGGSLLLAGSCMTGLSVSADAESSFTEGSITYTIAAGGVAVSGADSAAEKLTIPAETKDGKKVLRIADNALSGCASLKEVTIEPGLTEIGSGAFSQCAALESVSIPDSVTAIGAGAFYYCMALESLELPDSVKTLDEYVFSNCYALESIRLPRGLDTLPPYAFYYDIGLSEITLPDGLVHISEMSFVNCMSLKTLSLPASLTDFGMYSVLSCMGLDEIKVDPANPVYRTNDQGWLVTKDGKALVLYPAGCEERSATVANGIEQIMPYAFSGALALEEVRLPDSLTEIGDGAFADCRMLNKINLPFRLTSLPPSLFAHCANLSSVTIPENITSIGSYAFFCTGLTGVTIPEAVTSIDGYAFCGCSNLREVSVPKSVTEIGEKAFGYAVSSEEEGAEPTLDPTFVLHGRPASAAKKYAAESGVTFRQHGIDPTVLICVLAVAAAVLIIAGSLILGKKKSVNAADAAKGASAPEKISDPNYTSILDEDDGDPYDRSYGFSAEDDAEDDTEDDAEDTGAETEPDQE